MANAALENNSAEISTRAARLAINIDWPPPFAFFTYMACVVTLDSQAIKSGRHVATETNSKC
jgi:hypothetical protein